MRKYLKYLIITAFVLVIAAALLSDYAIKNIAPYAIIKTGHVTNRVLNDYLKMHYRKIEVMTNDSIKIVGYLIKSSKNYQKGTMIILHGIGDGKESQIGIAEFLSNNGYNAIILDLRAHGESGGMFCTYGYYEKYDISKVIDKVNSEIPDLGQIGIMGTSLGGAIAIQALATDKRLKCGIIVSTFSSLNEITYDYLKRLTWLPLRYISNGALSEASRIAKFPANEINPKEYAKTIEQPVLMIHGSDDDRIDIKYGKENFQNLRSSKKRFYEIKGANHNNINQVGGIKYREEILNYLNQHLATNALGKVKTSGRLPRAIKTSQPGH